MRLSHVLVCAALFMVSQPTRAATPDEERVINAFMHLLIGDPETIEPAFELIETEWHEGFVAMSLDVLSLGTSGERARRLIDILRDKTGQGYDFDLSAWYEWLWRERLEPHSAYADLKAAMYSLIDPDFRAYFDKDRPSLIRLDEIRWGGVRQDGIPPLRNPAMLTADEAAYLDDTNIVFGLEVNGDARAYPKRILAWHELFTDVIGGKPVAGVYCTLCGSMILYGSVHDGTSYALGTSGFLYRSNKLMYDRATQSLWSTLRGIPVVGPLVDRGIELERMSVVTTTWGAWRARHPDTHVLSLETGYERDYSEGAAYRDYFATDNLMFTVPELDRRLKNKDEVLGLVFPIIDATPLALASDFLSKNPIYEDAIGALEFVVLTDDSGAHRVYERGPEHFAEWDGNSTLVDGEGLRWLLEESTLTSEQGSERGRLPAHRAFWFGWFSAYPDTRLVY
jgi:hypothetical protein